MTRFNSCRFYLIFFLLFINLTACAPKLSKYLHANRFLNTSTIRVFNDSLQLQLCTPADIRYLTAEKEIKKAIQKAHIHPLNAVLLYGNTTDPDYHFLLTVGPEKERSTSKQWATDTIINKQHFHLIGISEDERAFLPMKTDLMQIKNQIKTGDHYQENNISVMDVVNAAMTSNLFYKTFEEIKQFSPPKNQGNSLEMQMLLTYASFLGINNPIYQELLLKNERSAPVNKELIKRIEQQQIINEAVFEHILSEAKHHQVVMINENHFYIQHRLFLMELLPRLKAIGYTHLAMEALATDSLLNQPGTFPLISTGFYTREQTYGNLLRKAKALGFTLIAYENNDPKVDREIGQAQQLYEKTLAIDKEAKVIVFAGIDHIIEAPVQSGKKWMAAVFKEKYGIDPLTISQTHFNTYRKNSNSDYLLLKKQELEPMVHPVAVDYFLVNNANKHTEFKKSFSYKNSYDQDVQVSLFYYKELKGKQYYENVPYFVGIAAANERLSLPYTPGQHILLVVYNKLGKVLETKEIIRKN